MVGALADWFAVTALFRHPLGLPIPHTAIIPRRKDQIGRSLGEFVQGNFLTREVLAERLQGVHVGRRLGRVAGRAGARRSGPSGFAGDAMKGVIEVLDDRDVADGDRRHGRAPAAAARRRPAARQGRRRLRRGRPPPAPARRHPARPGDVPRREPGHAARPAPAGVAVVGARAGRRPHLQQDLQRRAALPRRRRRGDPTTRCGARSRSASCCLAEQLRSDPRDDRQGRGAQGGAALAPRGAGLVRLAVGLGEVDDARRRRRPDERAARPRHRRAARVRRPPRRRRRAAGQARRLARAHARLRRRQLQGRGRRPHRHDRRALGQRRHVAPHRAAGRPRPPVHPHQRHRRRRHRRPRHHTRRPAACSDVDPAADRTCAR